MQVLKIFLFLKSNSNPHNHHNHTQSRHNRTNLHHNHNHHKLIQLHPHQDYNTGHQIELLLAERIQKGLR